MNKTLAALASFSVICATPALALDLSKIRSFRASPGMQITASFQTVIPVPASMSMEKQSKKTENARRALYQMADKECAIITQVFKGDCQIVRLNVRSHVQNRGNGLSRISISANANYRVRMNDQQMDNRFDKKL